MFFVFRSQAKFSLCLLIILIFPDKLTLSPYCLQFLFIYSFYILEKKRKILQHL